jgi:hypothetical protein
MFNVPGLGSSQPEVKTKAEAATKAAAETPTKQAHAGVKQALSEAFARPVADTDISVTDNRGKFRIIISPSVLPAKRYMTVFGMQLPFQQRQTGAVDAALANVNVGAKRRIFLRMFPERKNSLHASKTFQNEEALARFVLDCKQRLGNQPLDAETKAKAETDAKVKREVETKTTATPPVGGVAAGGPGGLPGMPGGLPVTPPSAPPSRGPGGIPGMPDLGGPVPSATGRGPGVPPVSGMAA